MQADCVAKPGKEVFHGVSHVRQDLPLRLQSLVMEEETITNAFFPEVLLFLPKRFPHNFLHAQEGRYDCLEGLLN